MMDEEVRCDSKLKPEQIHALMVLLNGLQEGLQPSVLAEYQEIRDICIQNQLLLFSQSVSTKTLPCNEAWRWNQTKSKKVVTIPNKKLTISLCKVIPRRNIAGSLAELPSLKIWIFKIISEIDTNHAIWCERGFPPETNNSPQLNVNEYSFLAPFMKAELAESIWPDMNKSNVQ